MMRELESFVDPFSLTNRFRHKRSQCCPNDGMAYFGCGYVSPQVVWVCPTCARESERESVKSKIY